MTRLILLFIVTELARIQPQNSCIKSTHKEYIGKFIDQKGDTDLHHFKSIRAINKQSCNDLCLIDDECFATLYNSIGHKCNLYNTTDLNFKEGDKQFSLWQVCNMSIGSSPKDGRCPGNWITYKNYSIKNYVYENLQELPYHGDKCKKECLNNPLCGYINHGNNSCFLIPKWPYRNIVRINSSDFDFIQWTCVDNYIEQLNVLKNLSQPIEEKCTGYWEIVNRNMNSNRRHIKGVLFHTQIFNDCLAECNQYANCHVALFNVTYSICVLPNISSARMSLPARNTVFIKFEWKCVQNDSHYPQMNEDETRYTNLGMKCRRIVSNKDLFIAKDDCKRYPSKDTKFFKCKDKDRYEVFENISIANSCQVNQSYWSFNESTKPLNLSGIEQMNVIKIYTGLVTYWLAYENNNTLGEVGYVECRSFNASRSKTKDVSFINRHKWYDLPPKGIFKTYDKPRHNLIITAVKHQKFSCKTLAACSDILRKLQLYFFKYVQFHYYDILFNFMIDSNGNIYECRGWDNQTALVYPFNYRTLSFAYIGSLSMEIPPEKFLTSVKKLIEYAIANKYLDKHYKLYLQQDFQSGNDSPNLVLVIKNWFRYKGFPPEYCLSYYLTIYLNIFPFLFVCILLRIFYTWLDFRMFCDKCRFLDCEEMKFQKIFPESWDIDEDQSDDTPTSFQKYKYHYIISQKPTFMSRESQSKVVDLIKMWYFNQFLETINSRYRKCNLRNFLTSNNYLKTSSFVYEVTEKHKKSPSSKIVLCVGSGSILRHFKRLTKMKRCICCYFSVYPCDPLRELICVLNEE